VAIRLSAVYNLCAAPGKRGAKIAALLKPKPDDFFFLKPKHSAFYLIRSNYYYAPYM